MARLRTRSDMTRPARLAGIKQAPPGVLGLVEDLAADVMPNLSFAHVWMTCMPGPGLVPPACR
jgi:hypothetical protein